jgi:tetratricopeptide (TPR) repeat protein
MPQPVTGDPALIKLWVQAITGQEQDAGKAVSVLDAAVWRERRARVMGTPLAAHLDGGKEDILAWHDATVGAHEIMGQVEPAMWHLERLLAARPQDWSLHARRAGLLHRGKHDAEALKELDLARELGGLASVRAWCAARAEGFELMRQTKEALWHSGLTAYRPLSQTERMRQIEEALWLREWIATADPNDAAVHNDLGHCKARLGHFAEASDHFTRAVKLAPDRIGYQRDLAMARLALDDRAGYRKACTRMIELAEATDDRAAPQMTALTCVLDAGTIPKWDAVIRLATRAAEGYDGDSRIHVAALFRAGRIAEALERPWSTKPRYAFLVWESFFQGMLRNQAGRNEEARAILKQNSKLIDFMDQEMPRDPKSKIWSDWIYYVQCHVLRGEAEALLRTDELRKASPPR